MYQIVAARGAMNGLMTQVIGSYILDHLLDDADHTPEAKQRDPDELVAALKMYIK
ncbi:metal-sensing transcriptional repressor [Dyella caseinilytica]|uniref:Uncharacterized protein n=1 Tax=Dyella caseinilytica TaxID=1849581 RepID=A0ABX7GW98_9GAMM|nr:metal-sensing transcriptional repressor [Dyella caseinilytica]QRN54739.1 hypothetical protein ISN74_05130 [Dyella caseinilytica]GFZ96537.1 hypothetical protein GCM10011408_16120 [Dyella caseinilytica]